MSPLVLAAALFLGLGTAPQDDRLVIVGGGRSDYEIVVASRALPTTRLAAEELRRFVRQATGVALPIVKSASAGKKHIYIASTDQLSPHGFAIQTKGADLYLRGHDSPGRDRSVKYSKPIHRGTCNAVYEFLERFVGVRWFWSDPLGEIVPHLDEITVAADLVIKQEPHFDYRALVYGPMGSRKGDWPRRNRLGSEFQMRHGHALHRIVPINDWARRGHPEYAAMRAGTRRIKPAGGHSGGHVCTGNPDVVRIVAKTVIDRFAFDPDYQTFSISLPDGSGVCTCELCKRHDVPGLKVPIGVHTGWPVITDRILEFYNSVATLVSAEFPDRLLGGYLYMDYLFPPQRTIAVHPMLMLVVAPNRVMETWDDGVRVFHQDLFKSWGAFHDRVYAHDIYVSSRTMFGLPAPLGDRSAEAIRLFAEAGLRGAYMYIGPTWESQGAESYLLTRLLWDPDADIETARREYYGLLYQRAAGPVRSYFETAATCWRERTTRDRAEVARLAKAFYRTKEFPRVALAGLVVGYEPHLNVLEKHVIDAERLAKGDPLLERRVARLRDSYTLTATTIAGLRAVVDYELDSRKDRRKLRPLVQAIEARETLLKRVGMSYAPALTNSLRFADKDVHSPLLFGGHYHKLARQ